MILFAVTHVCPEFLYLAPISPWTAASTSALGNTMNGALPPNSNATLLTVSLLMFERELIHFVH